MSRIQKNPTVIADEVDGKTMLCNTNSVEFFRLNSTGAQIWQVCDNQTVDEIVNRLSKVYAGEDCDALTNEVQRFVESLTDCGLVALEEAPNERASTRSSESS